MSAPKDEAIQTQAFNSLLPNVDIIKSFYELSTRLGDGLVHLLEFLAGKMWTVTLMISKACYDDDGCCQWMMVIVTVRDPC